MRSVDAAGILTFVLNRDVNMLKYLAGSMTVEKVKRLINKKKAVGRE